MEASCRALTERYVYGCAITGLLKETREMHQRFVYPEWTAVEEIIAQNSMYPGQYGEMVYAFDPSDRVHVFLTNTMEPKRSAIENLFWIENHIESYKQIIEDLKNINRRLYELHKKEVTHLQIPEKRLVMHDE